MRLTAMTDYALRLLMYLGRQPDRLCTIAEVAQVHGLSRAHLMKITYQLGRRGWITTVRGKGGGMTLARPPQDINLGAVVRSVEPDFQLVECMGRPSPDGCALTRSCPLAAVFGDALESFLARLDAKTLADVLPPEHALDAATRSIRVALPSTRRAGRAAHAAPQTPM